MGAQLLCADTEETLNRFHLNDTSLLNHNRFSANQNHRFFIYNITGTLKLPSETLQATPLSCSFLSALSTKLPQQLLKLTTLAQRSRIFSQSTQKHDQQQAVINVNIGEKSTIILELEYGLFWTGSLHVADDSLKLLICLPPPPTCWC